MSTGFANTYLSTFRGTFFIEPERFLPFDLAVVIPCFNEPEIGKTLGSLFACDCSGINVVAVVVINDSDDSPVEAIHQNQKTFEELKTIANNHIQNVRLFVLYAPKMEVKHAGVGWARKIGMDWAVAQFNHYGNKNGIIVSLDADTLVEENYIQTIYSHFKKNGQTVGATIYFEHPFQSTTNNLNKYDEAITMYELYMRYYRNALHLTKFPHSIYTVGSCFAVRADAYIAQGGMNRRKAGEDFYFLHKLAMFGPIYEMNETTVYPSSRLSDRVPFGTGPAIKRYYEGDSTFQFTYPMEAFLVLKSFFSKIDVFYAQNINLDDGIFSDNEDFICFLREQKFKDKLIELIANCGNFSVFEKRFFHLFNAFMILKWLNFSSSHSFPKKELVTECQSLLDLLGFERNTIPLDAKLMLNLFRCMDKERTKH